MSPAFFLRRVLLLLTILLGVLGSSAQADDFLDPEQAFKLSAELIGERQVQLRFEIAPGYYMYRDQFKLEPAEVTLGAIDWPKPKRKFDETFQKEVETYRDQLVLTVPVTALNAATLRLGLTGQGCADKGLCYPPMTSELELGLRGFGGDGAVRIAAAKDAMSGFGL